MLFIIHNNHLSKICHSGCRIRAIHKQAILMSLLSIGLLTITNIYQTLSVRSLIESVSQAILAKKSSEYM